MKKLIVLLAATLMATTSMAADTLWSGTIDNDWATAGNWTNGVPGATDSARIYTGTADITTAAGSIDDLLVGRSFGDSTVNIGADLTVTDDAYMGYASTATDVATINQTAGTVLLGNDASDRVHFGRGAGQSVYNFSGGTLTSAGDYTRFGNWDDGYSTFTFNQSGGTYTDTGSQYMMMCDNVNATSIINLSGGTFSAETAGGFRMGLRGLATINMSGADTVFRTTSGESALGYWGATDGSYLSHGIVNMTNGTFTAGGTIFSIGRSGNGTFTQVGGTVNMDAGDTYIGRYGGAPDSKGILNLSDGTFTVSDNLHIGAGDGAEGVINQTGGTLEMQQYSTLGYSAGGYGEINLDGGTMSAAGTDFYIGRSGDGTFNQTGGSFTSSTRTSIGRYGDSVGVVKLSGGTFTVTGSDLYVGYEADGSFIQTGGDLEVERLRLAQNTAAATGFYSISGGSLKANAYITGGLNGTGTFEVLGSGATSIEAANISFYDDTLRVVLDAGGSTLMVADSAINSSYNGQIDIRGVFELDTDGTFDGVIGDVYNIGWASDVILTNGTVSTTFTVLSGTEFEMSILDSVDRYGNAGTGQMLQVTVIPEPATLGMIAFVGGAMLWIRRKFMI